jgi:glutamate-1-semialdehyde aminotransferase
MAVFSKALGNGYPIAAIIGKGKIMDAAQKTFISSTMWTERIGPTAALATIKKHRAVDAGKHLVAIGELVQEGWNRLANKSDIKIDVGGIPPLSHFAFEYDNNLAMKALFVQMMLEKGFLASTSFYSMYAHKSYHVESYLRAVDDVFNLISEAIKKGDVERRLKGKPATAGFKRIT